MNHQPLEEGYFEWLAVQVVNARLKNPTLTYWHILRQLHRTEFVWRVHNDENRVEDGRELRSEYLLNTQQESPAGWLSEGCSFLEMLLALSRRFSFQLEGTSVAECFWHMLANASLHISDREYEDRRLEHFVDQVLQMLNNRTYDRTGRGGLFPLHDATIDQTTVELWYQMNYYLLERI